MANKKGKLLGILAIFFAFLIVSYSSLSITSPNILDTDASTYIIVVMLMLFVFIIFGAKEDLTFKYSKKNIAYSVVIFLGYILILSFLKVFLSFGFLSYRIDALLFPIPLLAFIILAFGTNGAKKLLPLIIYAAFASPFILLPLLNLNSAFANINAVFIYDVIKSLGIPVSKIGLMITSNAGSSITISTTCVSIGTFVAFVMFLIPIAYLYDGKFKNKFYWITSGVALILILNFARMLSIALIWAFYGLSSAVNLFHTFAGQLIFYAAIILMVLLTYKYDLSIRKAKKGTMKSIRKFYESGNKTYIAIILIFVLAIIGFVFNYGYNSSVYAPTLSFYKNASTTSAPLNQKILASLENSKSDVLVLGSGTNGEVFLLRNNNSSINDSIYVVTNVSYMSVPGSTPLGYTLVGKPSSYLLKNGISITAERAYSDNNTFEINYFALPYNLSGSWATVNYFVFEKTNNLPQDCNISGKNSLPNYFESLIYNIIKLQSYSTSKIMCQSYLIAASG
jgi:exosortase/archaeosortase family protein